MFVAALAFVGENVQWPLAVMPVIATVSVVAAEVLNEAVITVWLLPSGAEIDLAAVGAGLPERHTPGVAPKVCEAQRLPVVSNDALVSCKTSV